MNTSADTDLAQLEADIIASCEAAMRATAKVPWTDDAITPFKRAWEAACAANPEAVAARLREWDAMTSEEREAFAFVVLNYGRTYT